MKKPRYSVGWLALVMSALAVGCGEQPTAADEDALGRPQFTTVPAGSVGPLPSGGALVSKSVSPSTSAHLNVPSLTVGTPSGMTVPEHMWCSNEPNGDPNGAIHFFTSPCWNDVGKHFIAGYVVEYEGPFTQDADGDGGSRHGEGAAQTEPPLLGLEATGR